MQKGVVKFEDLSVGMKVTGKIKNVVDFGAFVDIGLHETGFVHISELSDSFVKDPMDAVKVGDVKDFTIIGLDADRLRISLSLKSDAASRIGHEGMSAGRSSAAGKSGDGTKRRVVVVKKAGSGAAATKAAGGYKGGNRDGQRRDKQYSGSDDGMYYNPFAALLKK